MQLENFRLIAFSAEKIGFVKLTYIHGLQEVQVCDTRIPQDEMTDRLVSLTGLVGELIGYKPGRVVVSVRGKIHRKMKIQCRVMMRGVSGAVKVSLPPQLEDADKPMIAALFKEWDDFAEAVFDYINGAELDLEEL